MHPSVYTKKKKPLQIFKTSSVFLQASGFVHCSQKAKQRTVNKVRGLQEDTTVQGRRLRGRMDGARVQEPGLPNRSWNHGHMSSRNCSLRGDLATARDTPPWRWRDSLISLFWSIKHPSWLRTQASTLPSSGASLLLPSLCEPCGPFCRRETIICALSHPVAYERFLRCWDSMQLKLFLPFSLRGLPKQESMQKNMTA